MFDILCRVDEVEKCLAEPRCRQLKTATFASAPTPTGGLRPTTEEARTK